jgi:hypothetical protein
MHGPHTNNQSACYKFSITPIKKLIRGITIPYISNLFIKHILDIYTYFMPTFVKKRFVDPKFHLPEDIGR